MTNKTLQLNSTLTCPECGSSSKERMSTDACQYYYKCAYCGVLLKPLVGDCCVYCSYGDIPCPPMQLEKGCCVNC